MIHFGGGQFLALHDFAQADAPQLHAQRTQFAGIWGESAIILGVGGRAISIDVWLSDASFSTAAAVDAYRAQLDLLVGTTGALALSDSRGNALATFADVTFEGYAPSSKILPALGAGLPANTFFQIGRLRFHQNSVP